MRPIPLRDSVQAAEPGASPTLTVYSTPGLKPSG